MSNKKLSANAEVKFRKQTSLRLDFFIIYSLLPHQEANACSDSRTHIVSWCFSEYSGPQSSPIRFSPSYMIEQLPCYEHTMRNNLSLLLHQFGNTFFYLTEKI